MSETYLKSDHFVGGGSALSSALSGLGVTGLTGVTLNPQLALVPYAQTGSGCTPTPCVLFEAAQQVISGTSNWQSAGGFNPFSAQVTPGTGDYAVFTVEVPGPIVGAGMPGLIAACVSLLVLGRRRKQIAV